MNTLNASRNRYGIIVSACFILHLLVVQPGNAQEAARSEPVNTVVLKDTTKTHSPKLAGALSAALPGLGQIYNKKYWKVPLIYAGAGALLFAIKHNASRYATYKKAYSLRIDGRSEEHTSELQSRRNLVCRLLLEKKKKKKNMT